MTDWILFCFGFICCLNVINMILTETISFIQHIRMLCLLGSQYPLLFLICLYIWPEFFIQADVLGWVKISFLLLLTFSFKVWPWIGLVAFVLFSSLSCWSCVFLNNVFTLRRGMACCCVGWVLKPFWWVSGEQISSSIESRITALFPVQPLSQPAWWQPVKTQLQRPCRTLRHGTVLYCATFWSLPTAEGRPWATAFMSTWTHTLVHAVNQD